MKPKSQISQPMIAAGQTWRLNDDSTCLIREVGKTLVHYKTFKRNAAGILVRIGNTKVLAKHLMAMKAVLVLEAKSAKVGKSSK